MTTHILVTGANQGIGRGLVKRYLLRPDTTVIATVRDPTSAAAQSFLSFPHGDGSSVILVKVELRSESDVKNALESLVSDHGLNKLDVVVANAGVFDASAHQAVVDLKITDLQHHLDVNAYSVVRLFQASWPLLQKSSRPVFLLNSAAAASMGGQATYARFPLRSYALSKTVANFLTLRLHFEHPELIAFAVHPGSVVTENRTAIAAKLGVPVEGISVEDCVDGLVSLIDTASREVTSGTFLNYNGTPLPW